jgi:hypothetical protein
MPDQDIYTPQRSKATKEKWWARKSRNAQAENAEPRRQPDQQQQQQRQDPADPEQNHVANEPASSSAPFVTRQRAQDLERQ